MLLSLRGLTVICGTKQNEKMLFVSLIQIGNMRNGNISILNQKSVIFKLVLLKIIQRRNCAVLIINVRSGMHDMTLNFKPENGASVKREDCSVRLYQQCFYSKGANIKIVIAHENFMLLI